MKGECTRATKGTVYVTVDWPEQQRRSSEETGNAGVQGSFSNIYSANTQLRPRPLTLAHWF